VKPLDWDRAEAHTVSSTPETSRAIQATTHLR
jgi:hypothetical protein